MRREYAVSLEIPINQVTHESIFVLFFVIFFHYWEEDIQGWVTSTKKSEQIFNKAV